MKELCNFVYRFFDGSRKRIGLTTLIAALGFLALWGVGNFVGMGCFVAGDLRVDLYVTSNRGIQLATLWIPEGEDPKNLTRGSPTSFVSINQSNHSSELKFIRNGSIAGFIL